MTPTIAEKRSALATEIRSFVERVKSEGREPTPEELAAYSPKLAQLREWNEVEEKSRRANELLSQMHEALPGAETRSLDGGDYPARSLGEHFVKHAGKRLAMVKGQSGISVAAPEWKAATDTQTVGGLRPGEGTTPGGLAFPTIDTRVVRAYRPQPVVADLLGQGTLAGTALTYFVEGPREGGFAAVGEGGLKPQIHYTWGTVTEALSKIAGFIKLSDEMVEDLPYLVSEINSRLLYDLSMEEDAQLLNGTGTAPNLRGLLQRSGVQDETSGGVDDDLDAIYRALSKIQTATGLTADGVVVHPADYEKFRLRKDGNQQYYGGGPFAGQYGNGGVPINPPIWGLRTVVSASIAQGTALVGAFSQAATVYRKGGVRVESTNSNGDDFIHNRITIRAEERLALAVRVPMALCVVNVAANAPAV